MPDDSLLKEIMPDIKSDLLKSAMMGIIATIAAAIFSLANEAIPAEIKQTEFIAAVGLAFGLLSLTIILISRHRTSPKLILSIVLFLITITSGGYWFFNYKFVLKGLPSTLDRPTLIVFYPSHVKNAALQNRISLSIRKLPGRLVGLSDDHQILKIALPEYFEFEKSFLKKHIDHSVNMIAYARLIPDGEKIFIKLDIPATLPYLKMGFENMRIVYKVPGVNTNQDLALKWEGFFENLVGEFEISEKYSHIHYGVDNHFLAFSVRIYYQGKVDRPDVFNPLEGSLVVENTGLLSGSIYFALASGAITYYTMFGEPENFSSCDMLKEYFNLDRAETAKNNLRYLHQSILPDCLPGIPLEDKEWLMKSLSTEQQKQLKKDLLYKLIQGRKTKSELLNLGLYEDDQAIDLVNKIAEDCRKKTGYQYSTILADNFSEGNLAACLQFYLQKNIRTVKQHSLLKFDTVEIIQDLYDESANQPIYMLMYMRRMSELYRVLDQSNRTCDSMGDTLASILLINEISAAFTHKDIKQFFYNLRDDLQKIYQLSKCEQITVLGVGTRRLVLEKEGQSQVEKLADDLTKDIQNDVTIAALLDHVESNLVSIVDYLGSEKAKRDIRKWFNAIRNGFVGEFDYFKQHINIPDGITVPKLSPALKEKFTAPFQDITINDKLSRLIKATELLPTLNKLTNLEEVNKFFRKSSLILEEYFLDPFAKQLFSYFRNKLDHTIMEHKANTLYNRTLDQIILSLELLSSYASPEQRHHILQILKNEYADSIPASRIKHYEFYSHYKNGEVKDAQMALDQLITLNETPYVDFYRFAKSVLTAPSTVSVCPGNPKATSQILEHLLDTPIDQKYWQPQTGKNAFNKTLTIYLEQFILNEKETSPELVKVFQSCNIEKPVLSSYP